MVLFTISVCCLLLALNYFNLAYLPYLQSNASELSTNKSQPKPLLIRSSIPYWDQQNASRTFEENISLFNQISLFWYYLNSQGKITKYQYAKIDPSIIALAQKYKIKSFFTLTNLGEQEDESWDSTRVEKVLASPTSRQNHIKDILNIFNSLPFDAVTIDYEAVSPSQRRNFTQFIYQLSESLHQKNKLLAIAIHPVSNRQTEQRYYFQDIVEIAKAADILSVMAYGEHDDESQPGPIASISWLNKITNYLHTKNLPLQKIFLGIPLYGYDWAVKSHRPAEGLTFQAVEQLAVKNEATLRWDNQSKSPYFTYSNRGQTHQVWYEDARSVNQKMKLAQANGLGGVSFWRLGGEDPKVWQVVKHFK